MAPRRKWMRSTPARTRLGTPRTSRGAQPRGRASRRRTRTTSLSLATRQGRSSCHRPGSIKAPAAPMTSTRPRARTTGAGTTTPLRAGRSEATNTTRMRSSWRWRWLTGTPAGVATRSREAHVLGPTRSTRPRARTASMLPGVAICGRTRTIPTTRSRLWRSAAGARGRTRRRRPIASRTSAPWMSTTSSGICSDLHGATFMKLTCSMGATIPTARSRTRLKTSPMPCPSSGFTSGQNHGCLPSWPAGERSAAAPCSDAAQEETGGTAARQRQNTGTGTELPPTGCTCGRSLPSSCLRPAMRPALPRWWNSDSSQIC
mmetsp:Transcript_36107/g.101643  ORF Transcript_36107/g.101643 Transcript_36107/m.101643 type:complete len:317 (-) Transcript_36107:278-1228(-)